MILTGTRTRAAVLWMVVFLSLEASCARFGFERDEMRQQQSVEAGVPDLLDPDASERDGPTGDGGDGSSIDIGTKDRGVLDAAVVVADKGVPDLPVTLKDKGEPDAVVIVKDQGVPDAPVKDLNVAIKDLKPATQACASKATQASLYPGGTMAVCSLTSGPASLNQCQAEALCNTSGGWHLCTASEYQSRGGTASQWPAIQAWIKGCIRTNDKLFAPTDQLCEPTCGVITGKQIQTAWDCVTGIASFNYANENIGLSKANICWRVGINDPSTEARWSPLAASVPLDSALCCSP